VVSARVAHFPISIEGHQEAEEDVFTFPISIERHQDAEQVVPEPLAHSFLVSTEIMIIIEEEEEEGAPEPRGCSASPYRMAYRGTSLIRNSNPPWITLGPSA